MGMKMMTPSEDDLALQTLLAVAEETAPTLDATLLRQCYAIQKKHQFSEDRTQSATAMERLIDAKLSGSTDDGVS
jgi:hypothetical protein